MSIPKEQHSLSDRLRDSFHLPSFTYKQKPLKILCNEIKQRTLRLSSKHLNLSAIPELITRLKLTSIDLVFQAKKCKKKNWDEINFYSCGVEYPDESFRNVQVYLKYVLFSLLFGHKLNYFNINYSHMKSKQYLLSR